MHPDAHDFEEISAAVMETARGRWFLSEFARRNRSADTLALLDAIERLSRVAEPLAERADAPAQAEQAMVRIVCDLARLRREIAVSLARSERTRICPETALPDLVADADRHVARTHALGDRLQKLAWSLRDTDGQNGAVVEIDRVALDLLEEARRQGESASRIRTLAAAFAGIESVGRLVAGDAAPEAAEAPEEAAPENGEPGQPDSPAETDAFQFALPRPPAQLPSSPEATRTAQVKEPPEPPASGEAAPGRATAA